MESKAKPRVLATHTKPRAVVTYKVLAVALTAAAAGCTRSPAEGVQAVPVPQEITGAPAAQGAPGAARAAPGQGAPASADQAPPAPGQAAPPERAMSEDPALLALRDELLTSGRAGALAKTAHFRPLCDKDGYPLVGNLVRKTPKPEFQPSEFCSEVRRPK